MAIPDFNTDGNLPPGVHLAGWNDFEGRFAITPRRRRLANGLGDALSVLRAAGCQRAYVDGSYVTEKATPNDYDVAWEPSGVDLRLLLSMEPLFFFNFDNLRAAQKAKFFGEFFPSSASANSVGTTFFEFFQVDKNTGNAKGIIALDL